MRRTWVLPAFDNALLSHNDRTRIISDEHRKVLFRDRSMRGVLLDGFACATWKTEQRGGKLTLVVEPFEPLTEENRDVLSQEGERLLDFLAGPQGVSEFEIRFDGGDA